jgi:hypothetical protein
MPLATPSDPAEDPPSSVDPLGTLGTAERIADVLLPGMTARMWRPRLLTFAALATAVAQRAAERENGDEQRWLEARLAFERMFVSALVRRHRSDPDEKMFRVVRDRERWFHVVMGQKSEFHEAASESIADRVPLPPNLARELTFNLRRWSVSAEGTDAVTEDGAEERSARTEPDEPGSTAAEANVPADGNDSREVQTAAPAHTFHPDTTTAPPSPEASDSKLRPGPEAFTLAGAAAQPPTS